MVLKWGSDKDIHNVVGRKHDNMRLKEYVARHSVVTEQIKYMQEIQLFWSSSYSAPSWTFNDIIGLKCSSGREGVVNCWLWNEEVGSECPHLCMIIWLLLYILCVFQWTAEHRKERDHTFLSKMSHSVQLHKGFPFIFFHFCESTCTVTYGGKRLKKTSRHCLPPQYPQFCHT